MKDQFSHMLVSKAAVYCNGIGIAYCIGTYAYCARYALQHGIRATTMIIEA